MVQCVPLFPRIRYADMGARRTRTCEPGSRAVGQPLKERVADAIRLDIAERRYPRSRPIPSYSDLGKLYGVSRNTVIGAMDRLEAEGLIYRAERRGTFVRATMPPRNTHAGPPQLNCINFISTNAPAGELQMQGDWLEGYTAALEGRDVRMRFAMWNPHDDHYENLLGPGADLQGQGCVLLNIRRPSILRWLHDKGIPFVVQCYRAYSREGLPPHASVVVNKHGGGFDATEYLLDLGHRRIGYVGETRESDNVPTQFQGYRGALNSHGLPPLREDILDIPCVHAATAVQPATEYLKRTLLPTAVFCPNEATAIAVLQAARRVGMRVPEDLSVVGFDVGSAGETELVAASPALTLVVSPRRAQGKAAVEMLLALTEGRGDPEESRILDCHLLIRESTAAPGGGRGEN